MTRKKSPEENLAMLARTYATADHTIEESRWVAVRSRDARADGTFVYSVETTGVYCHPSCGARPANRENVAFHPDAGAATRAGFRPCKRCKSNEPPLAERRAALIATLCRFIESSEVAPTLEALAARAGLSPFHVHRVFKAVIGLTPKAYAEAHRAGRARSELGARDTVTEAIHGAGYVSSARFYENASARLGMTPTAFRAGAPDLEIRFAIGECSLGAILVAATTRGVCAILLGDDPEELAHDLERRFSRAKIIGADASFEATVAEVVGLVEAPRLGTSLPLDIRGTAFQERVWKALRSIPAGKPVSYTELASAIGAPRGARAVATACAANPLAVAIPCHRVVRTDGTLLGYRWGVERKRVLLARETS